MKSNKIVGIILLLIYVCVATALLNDAFIKPYNLQNLLRSSSMFAIIGIGAVLVIVTGGIDLSTGSLIGLVGCTMTMTLKSFSEHPPGENGAWFLWWIGMELLVAGAVWAAFDAFVSKRYGPGHAAKWKAVLIGCGIILAGSSLLLGSSEQGAWLTMAVAVGLALWLSAHLGLLHGLLITRLKLQPFVVTLCGLMCYRGLSRYLTGDKTQGLGTEYNDSLRLLAIGKPCTVTAVMAFFSVLLILAGIWKSFISKRSRDDSEARTNGYMILLIGAILAVVSSSRYWNGWETEFGETMATIAGMEFKFFTLSIPDQAIGRPAVLMSYAFWPMLACFAALTVWTGRRNLMSTAAEGARKFAWALPLIFTGLWVGALILARRWIGDETISLTDMSAAFEANVEADADDRFVAGVNVILLKLGSIFLSMAGLMGGILWMGRSWTKGSGNTGRALWIMTGFFAILWLLGNTAIHQTVVQTPFFFLLIIGALAALFLNTTVWGRYFLALGNNEEATRYSGINTDGITVMAYVLCALCGGIGSVLFTLDSNNVEPSGHGSFYELYAIAAAVLGGCSLRGGQGSILGVIIGASIMRVLYNAPDMIGIASQLEMFTIGFVLLIGIIVDETARRIAANRDRKVVSDAAAENAEATGG
ncbi:MAG: hypothetical protein AAF456_21990 [Planctomycetota bacterium]